MFSEEGDWVWSNKADEWLGQRFLPHNLRPNSVKNADQPKLRGEGSSTLAFSIWIYSPFLPCLSLRYSHSHRLWIRGTSPAQLDVLRKNASVMLKLLDIKNLESKHKKAEIISHTGVVLWWFELQSLCLQSSHSHGAVWTKQMAVPQSWACDKSRSSHIDEGKFWSIPNAVDCAWRGIQALLSA